MKLGPNLRANKTVIPETSKTRLSVLGDTGSSRLVEVLIGQHCTPPWTDNVVSVVRSISNVHGRLFFKIFLSEGNGRRERHSRTVSALRQMAVVNSLPR